MFEFEDYVLMPLEIADTTFPDTASPDDLAEVQPTGYAPEAADEAETNEPPAPMSDERLEQLEEANEALGDWFDDTYGEDPDEIPTAAEMEQDFKEGLREGDEKAWDAAWELAEYLYGMEDIENDPFWSQVVTENIAEAIFGTSEGLIYDPAQGKIIFDPNYEPSDGGGDDYEDEEEDDEDRSDHEDEDEFDFYGDDDDDDDEPGGTVTVLFEDDDEDEY